MKRLTATAIPLALFAIAPLWAKAPPSPEKLATMSDEDLGTAFAKANDRSNATSACDAAPYVSEIARRRHSGQMDGYAAFFNGLCALMQGRSAEALKDADTVELVTPVADLRDMSAGVDQMALYGAGQSKNWTSFAEHAGHVAHRDSAEEFEQLDPDLFRFGLQRMTRKDSDATVLAFVRADAFDHLDKDLRQTVAYRAIGAALRADDLALASRMFATVEEPESYLDMLIDREYEPLWPHIAKEAGPHLRAVIGHYAAKTDADRAANPGDAADRKTAARAKLLAGDYAGVVDLASGIDQSDKGLAKIGEDDAWLLNTEVMALDRLDRRAEADRIFDGMARLSPKGRGWLVNFVINRADRLVGVGRWAEALPAAELAVKVAETQGSPYAKEVAAADRYCAAIKADPARDLAVWWQEIDANWKENIGAAVQAAQCKGDPATAIRYLREGLRDEDNRHTVLLALQPRAADFYRDEGNMFEEPRKYLEQAPDLKALYEQYGRDLPDGLLPQTGPENGQNASVSK